METLSPLRIHLLRAMYLLIFVGLGLTIWPGFFQPATPIADSHTVISTIMVSFSLMALLGLRYPLKLIPLLLFELLWKSLWIANYASRMWLADGLDEYATAIFVSCIVGVILTPIAIPWSYVFQTYLKGRGDPWNPKKAS